MTGRPSARFSNLPQAAIPMENTGYPQFHYRPPWANTSIIGVAGSSGSGKTSLAVEIVKSLSLPWVVILSMVRIS